jgi:peptidyl-dipeptidase Dcp
VKGKPGEAAADLMGRRNDDVPRIWPRVARLEFKRHLPVAVRNCGPRDYVEFPSQLLEHWLSTPEVLQRFALHYETGKPIPQALVDKINRSATFNQGFCDGRVSSGALVDHRNWHLAGASRRRSIPMLSNAENAGATRQAERDRDAPSHTAVSARLCE